MSLKKCVVFLTIIFASGFLLTLDSAFSAPAEKKLLVAVGMEPTTMDHSMIATGGDHTILQNWSEYLIDQAHNGDLIPGLATSWKVSPDGKIMEFTLRKGVKFHSGDPLTARDIQFSMERELAKNPSRKTYLDAITRFEIVDDYRFKIHFPAPDVGFIPNRATLYVVSKSYFDRVGEQRFEKEPSGTGPYKFVKYVPGEYVDIERFDGYWGKKPSVREARFLFVPEDTTRIAKLKTGEVDFITSVAYPSIKDILNTRGLKIIKLPLDHPTPSVAFATYNPNVPWYDRRVRLAMAYAIDCDSIIKNLLDGIPNHWPFLTPGELGYDSDLKNYPYDPKRAKQLLAETGYPNGFELPLYYQSGSRIAMIREVGEAVASYFGAIGIKTKLIGEEAVPYRAKQRTAKGPTGVFVNWGSGGRSGSPEASRRLESYFSKDGGFSTYYNPELEKIIDDAKSTMDDRKRGELIKKGIRIVYDDVASIPVFNYVSVLAMKNNIDYIPTQRYAQETVFVKDITIK